jgi:hypothetical protein
LKEDVEGVRSLAVADLHSWLGRQPECVGPDGEFSRDKVKGWVENNQGLVESWLERNSKEQRVAFEETLPGKQSSPAPTRLNKPLSRLGKPADVARSLPPRRPPNRLPRT